MICALAIAFSAFAIILTMASFLHTYFTWRRNR
jgi:hypothetical protein